MPNPLITHSVHTFAINLGVHLEAPTSPLVCHLAPEIKTAFTTAMFPSPQSLLSASTSHYLK